VSKSKCHVSQHGIPCIQQNKLRKNKTKQNEKKPIKCKQKAMLLSHHKDTTICPIITNFCKVFLFFFAFLLFFIFDKKTPPRIVIRGSVLA